MPPAALDSSVFFDPSDFNDIDAILHYDDDPKHATHICLNCRRVEAPNNVCPHFAGLCVFLKTNLFAETRPLHSVQIRLLL
jgi:hypothetical protein